MRGIRLVEPPVWSASEFFDATNYSAWATDEGIIQDYISKAVREQAKARDRHDCQVAHILWGWHR